MPRIAPNLRERVIGMLNSGMATNEVARIVGSSSRAIRNFRQRFQATRRTEDLPRSCVRASRRLIKTAMS